MASLVSCSGAPTEKKDETLSGFIFMCSGTTKPECYINRVFGLPSGRREIVEKIKPGTKLFLFDFDVKLLYGVYEAVSNGGMKLKPTAFGGKFPAQVQFKICNGCYPLPVSSFRSAIKDNFQGSKFTPELNAQQVKDLLSLFVPIVEPEPQMLPPIPNRAPQLRAQPPPPNGAPGQWLQLPPPPIGAPLNPSLIRPSHNRYQPYRAKPSHNRAPQFVQGNVLNPQLPHLHSSSTHQASVAHVNPYQFVETRPPLITNEPYPRYMQPMPNPSYGLPHLQTQPPYGGPAYVQPQPAPFIAPEVVNQTLPVSSHYLFAGGLQMNR